MKKIIIMVLTILTISEIVMADMCFHKINITKVCDGDTIKGIVDGKEVPIRLTGIDCYETSKINRAYKQAYLNKISIEEVVKRGVQSKRILCKFLENHPNVKVKFTDTDRYDRKVGILYADNININEYMLQEGGCLVYEYKQ